MADDCEQFRQRRRTMLSRLDADKRLAQPDQEERVDEDKDADDDQADGDNDHVDVDVWR